MSFDSTTTQPIRLCEFSGCDKPWKSKGLCMGHYAQWWKGQELRPLKYMRPYGSLPQIICDEMPCPVPGLIGPCHVFRGGKVDGYGRIYLNNHGILVHRWIWEKVNGPIPDELVVDHQCKVRPCCNEDHLRIVTVTINAMENSDAPQAINARKTHCIRGHEFNEVNTHRDKNGERECRQCRRDKHARYRLTKAL